MRNHKQSGFSLVELLVTIGIMSIMMSIALPAFSEWRERSAAKTATDTLVAHLKQARIKAISENRSVTVTFDTTIHATTPNRYVVDGRVVELSQYSPNLTLNATTVGTCPMTLDTVATTFDIVFRSSGAVDNDTIAISGSPSGIYRVAVNMIGRTNHELCQ